MYYTKRTNARNRCIVHYVLQQVGVDLGGDKLARREEDGEETGVDDLLVGGDEEGEIDGGVEFTVESPLALNDTAKAARLE